MVRMILIYICYSFRWHAYSYTSLEIVIHSL